MRPFSERLRAARGKRSQAAAAVLMGVDAQTVSRWETGRTTPEEARQEALLARLSAPPSVTPPVRDIMLAAETARRLRALADEIETAAAAGTLLGVAATAPTPTEVLEDFDAVERAAAKAPASARKRAGGAR